MEPGSFAGMLQPLLSANQIGVYHSCAGKQNAERGEAILILE